VVLQTVGYIESKDLSIAASIWGSPEEKIMLSSGDHAYLNYPAGKPLQAGERYTIFEADMDNPVREPGTEEVLGYLVRIYGDVVVDQITANNIARGTLVSLTAPVERGYLISPRVNPFHTLDPRPSTVDLQARIVAALTPRKLLSAETFVVLNRGQDHGIQVGNRTFIVRQTDGYRRVLEDWDSFDPRYPKEIVGELFIVDVRKKVSLAWIARSTKTIQVGDTTEMHRGH
jgi:hypothetical protein